MPAAGVVNGVAVPAAPAVVAVGLAAGEGVAATVGVRVRVGAVVGVAVGAGAAQLTMRDKVSKSAATARSRFVVIIYLLYPPK